MAAVRVEWCKSYARRERWREEITLGEAEQEFTLASLAYEARAWRERAEVQFGSIQEQRGRQAYAIRQAQWREKLALAFKKQWWSLAEKRKRAEVDEE